MKTTDMPIPTTPITTQTITQPVLQSLAQTYWALDVRPWARCLSLAATDIRIPGTSKRDPITPAYMRRDWSGQALSSGLDCVYGRTVTVDADEGKGIAPWQRLRENDEERKAAEERLFWKSILRRKEGAPPCQTT